MSHFENKNQLACKIELYRAKPFCNCVLKNYMAITRGVQCCLLCTRTTNFIFLYTSLNSVALKSEDTALMDNGQHTENPSGLVYSIDLGNLRRQVAEKFKP